MDKIAEAPVAPKLVHRALILDGKDTEIASQLDQLSSVIAQAGQPVVVMQPIFQMVGPDQFNAPAAQGNFYHAE
jgi:hypothetical protein